MFVLRTTERFLKTAHRFLAQHPELEQRFLLVTDLLRNDPFHPSLKTNPLKGAFAHLHAVRLTYAYRITLLIIVKDKCITLVDIGSHD